MVGCTAALRSAKSMTQPVSSPTGPSTRTRTRKLCPWTRAHLCPAGTFGSEWADSNPNSLYSSIAAP